MKVLICGRRPGWLRHRRAACGGKQRRIDYRQLTADLVQRVSDLLDVRGFVGHGSQPDVLDEAGAGDADMIIAVTLHDEVNMVACQVAHSIFNIPTKIARVRAQSYLAPHWRHLFSREHMPIDVIISPEVEVGEMVMQRLSLPGAFETVSFGDGAVTVVGVICADDCPVVTRR